MCLVSPYEHLREELKQNNDGCVVEILLETNRELRKEYHVEEFEAGNPCHTIKTDEGAEKNWDILKEALAL